MDAFRIRAAAKEDLPRLTEIYNHYVTHTPVTFDIKPYTVEERSAWFGQFGSSGRYRLLVTENDAGIAGYAGTTRFRPKPAYETTVETTIYCAPEAIGKGIGSALYAALFGAIAGRIFTELSRDTPFPILGQLPSTLDLVSNRWECFERMAENLGAIGMSPGWSGLCSLGFSSTGTLACAGFAIVAESVRTRGLQNRTAKSGSATSQHLMRAFPWGCDFDGHLLSDREAVAFERNNFFGMVGQDPQAL